MKNLCYGSTGQTFSCELCTNRVDVDDNDQRIGTYVLTIFFAEQINLPFILSS